jgi:hypothetical protein
MSVVMVNIIWDDDPNREEQERCIAIGDPADFVHLDDDIFYYVEDMEELEGLTNPYNGEDFFVTKIFGGEE